MSKTEMPGLKRAVEEHNDFRVDCGADAPSDKSRTRRATPTLSRKFETEPSYIDDSGMALLEGLNWLRWLLEPGD